VTLTTYFQLEPMLRMSGALPLLPHTSPRRGQRKNLLFMLYLTTLPATKG